MKTHVLKIGGAVCADPAAMQTLVDGLQKASLGGDRWIIVHGAGPQLDDAIRALGEPIIKVDGLRVTSPQAANVVLEEMTRVGVTLCQLLQEAGISVQRLDPTTQYLAAQSKMTRSGIDLGRVGTPVAFHSDHLDDAGGVWIVTPVGFDDQGPLNVNADEGAAVIARGLVADQLILATDVDHVRDASGQSLLVLGPLEAKQLIENQAARDGMIPKLNAALTALDAGVEEVCIGRLNLTIFESSNSSEPSWGTRIVAAPVTEIPA